MFRLTKTLVVGIALAAPGAAIHAAPTGHDDDFAVSRAKISMIQAIGIAERRAHGRASSAEYERLRTGRWGYDIEVVSGRKVFDVKIDGDSGEIVAFNEDRPGHDDYHPHD